MRHNQVKPAGFAGILFLVLRGDQEEGRKAHDLPAEQEQDAVAGDHEQCHAGGQRAVEKPQFPAVPRMVGLLPVAQAVDVSQQRDQEDRHEEDGRQAVNGHAELGAGKGPRQHDRLTVSGRPERAERRPGQAPPRARRAAWSPTVRSSTSGPKSRPGRPLIAAMMIPRSTSDSLIKMPHHLRMDTHASASTTMSTM